MSKVVFIRNNSAAIRARLRNAGFSVCACASFCDAVWLAYHPEGNYPYDIHGTGYVDDTDEEWIRRLSPEERIKEWLTWEHYYDEEREFFDTVEDFLANYQAKGASNTETPDISERVV